MKLCWLQADILGGRFMQTSTWTLRKIIPKMFFQRFCHKWDVFNGRRKFFKISLPEKCQIQDGRQLLQKKDIAMAN